MPEMFAAKYHSNENKDSFTGEKACQMSKISIYITIVLGFITLACGTNDTGDDAGVGSLKDSSSDGDSDSDSGADSGADSGDECEYPTGGSIWQLNSIVPNVSFEGKLGSDGEDTVLSMLDAHCDNNIKALVFNIGGDD